MPECETFNPGTVGAINVGRLSDIFKSLTAMPHYYDALKSHFDEQGWKYKEVPGKPCFSLSMDGKNGGWSVIANVVEDKDVIMFYSMCRDHIPPDKRLQVAEFITRANYGLTIGNFEMDFDDGEVRYKTAIDAQGADELSGVIKSLLVRNLRTFDRYVPGIIEILQGNEKTNPADIVTRIESDRQQNKEVLDMLLSTERLPAQEAPEEKDGGGCVVM